MNWNDDRLDRLADEVAALRRHMDERFEKQAAQIQERFEKQEARIADRFEKQEARIAERFETQDARIVDRFDRLQNAMIITLGSILAAFGGAILSPLF